MKALDVRKGDYLQQFLYRRGIPTAHVASGLVLLDPPKTTKEEAALSAITVRKKKLQWQTPLSAEGNCGSADPYQKLALDLHQCAEIS